MSTPKAYNVAKNYSVMIYGRNIPLGALYGTFTGYSKIEPIKWLVANFPKSVHDTFHIEIYSFPLKRWIIAPQKQFRLLYRQVCQYIQQLDLIGCKVRYAIRNIQFPSKAPFGRSQKAIGFKQANNAYYDRGGSGHPIYGDMKRTKSGEREYRWDSPKTIVMGQPL